MPGRIKLAALAAAMLIALAGCGQKPPAEEPGSGGNPGGGNPGGVHGMQPPAAAEPQDSNEADQELSVKAYYADDQLEQLVEEQRTITFREDEDKYLAVLNELKSVSTTGHTALFHGFTFHSADMKDGLLTVNVTIAPEGRLGSGGEALALEALKRTLFQFEEVTAFDLLLDGQAVESLMGHMDLPHPMNR